MTRAEKPNSVSGEPKTRRWFLDRSAKALAGGWTAARFAGRAARYASWRIPVAAAALDQESRVFELTKTKSNIVISPEQKKRFRSKEFETYRNAVLVIGGATVQNSEDIAKAITLGLEPLGPVMAIDWSHTGFDMNSIAKDLLRLQEEYGMKNLSLYFHSMGDIEAGMLMPLIKDINVPMMIFDDSLVDLSDLKISRNSLLVAVEAAAKLPSGQLLNALIEGAELFSKLPFGYLVSWAAQDGLYYHNPFNSGIATYDLARAQFQAVENGGKLIDPLAKAAKKDESVTILLQPEHSQDDQVIDDDKAARDLKHRFPNLLLYRLPGGVGHADELQHPRPYNFALAELFKRYREQLKERYEYGLAA